MDLYVKSQQLLETLANSIHDREPKSPNPFFFKIEDVHAAEKWLNDFIREIKKECICS